MAVLLIGAGIVIAGCARLGSSGGKQGDTHVLTLKHLGYPSNPNQAKHAYRHIKWWLNEGGSAGFGLKVGANEWIEWHSLNEPNFAIAVRNTNLWKPGAGLSWINIPNLGTWPAVATTNGCVRLQFAPEAGTKAGHINYRIAIPPLAEIFAMQAPQSNYCDVDILETTVDFGGAFTNQMSGASERIR